MAKSKFISPILLILVLAQFIIVIDTTFMNVSLSTLVVDLHTTVTGVQSAITLYALVMAALMIPGAKFGDIIGRRKAFILGLIIYGCGTTITSLSGNLTQFIIGWSVLEGTGAALMLPAMMSLIADNFKVGPERSKAYAVFAATAGIAAALGPIVGGLFTTYLSWRLAFASELLVVLYILFRRSLIKEQALDVAKVKFDWVGFGFSAIGLIAVVEGIILASTYGFIKARVPASIAGITFSAGGISPSIVLLILGIFLLIVFYVLENSRQNNHKNTLLDIALLKIRTVRAGSTIQMMQQLVITGIIFALSLYVQMVLGYNAIKSGLTLLPLSIGILILSTISGRYLSRKFAPKHIIAVGFSTVIIGTLIMGLTARDATSGLNFLIGLFFIGSGVGAVVSQNQNLIISSVTAKQTNETSGIINTFQNVGASLGTSIAGAVIISVLISVATNAVNASTVFSSSQKTNINNAIVANAQVVSNQQLSNTVSQYPPDEQSAIIQINEEARQRALTVVYYIIGIVGLIGVISAIRLPNTKPLAAQGKVTASAV